jgi:hypothetical protein
MNKQKNTKAKHYQYNLLIKEAEIEYASTFNFKLLLKRGNKQVESKNTFKYEMSTRRLIEINELMDLISSFSYNEDGSLKEKQYKLFLQVYTKTGFKNAAYTEINLLDYIDKTNEDVEFEFKKHPFTMLKLRISITSKFLTDIDVRDALDFSKISDEDLNASTISRRETHIERKSIAEEVESRTPKKSLQVASRLSDKVIVTDNTVLEKVNKEKAEKFDSEKNEYEELNKLITKLENENKDLKEKLATKSEKSIRTDVMDEDEKERMLNELRTENDYYIEEIDQLKSIIADLKTEKTKVYEEKIKSIKALNEEIEKLKESNKLNENMSNKYIKEKTEFETKVQALNQNVNDLNIKIVQNE